MVFVAGATGHLGTEICRRLVSRGETVRGLVRTSSDPDRVENLREIGVEPVTGDLKEPGTLAPHLDRVQTVISTATATRSRADGDGVESVDEGGQMNLIRAAADAGVERFVLVSFTGNIQTDDPLTRAKRSSERLLKESGMTYTILRPSFFMEVWLSPALGFDYPNGRVQIFGDGEQKVSYISFKDVAEFAVQSLKTPEASNAVVELGGPEPMSPNEIVRIFEETSGRIFEVSRVPRETLQQQFDAAEDSMSRSFTALMLATAAGDTVAMDRTLQIFPISLFSVRDYAEAVAGTDRPSSPHFR